MHRRDFLSGLLAVPWATAVCGAVERDDIAAAVEILQTAVDTGPLEAAVISVARRDQQWTHRVGKVSSDEAPFLLGSITKPICMTALMTLFDRRAFQLDDPVRKFLPKFNGTGREQVTIRHLLTHVSGLPDQLPNNAELRGNHAALSEFVEGALQVPLGFPPGSKYLYSSMGILLAAQIAEEIAGVEIRSFVEQSVLRPLGMTHSALGLGRFKLEEVMPCQTAFAAPEAGAGDPAAKNWDWNSHYWRQLGAPWGGGHASAGDLVRFLGELMHQRGAAVQPKTAQLITTNHNPPGLTPRGLGFAVGAGAGSQGCSERTFGHTGSTGTICWADPATETICVVLTTLPARAVPSHPRDLAAARISRVM